MVQPLLTGDFKCTKMWSLLVANVGSEHNYDFAAASPKENKQIIGITLFIATKKEYVQREYIYARKKKL